MNLAGSTNSLVGNESITALKIIYIWHNFIEAGIVDRVEIKDRTGFMARYALCKNDLKGLNIPLMEKDFLNVSSPSCDN
jgi:hypothetical protein